MIRGILPPLTTPFREDGALDLAAFEANLDDLRDPGPRAAYLVLGSNGEAPSLDEREKLALVRAARARAPARRTVLVGTGLESTRATIALTRSVADLGADARARPDAALLQVADDRGRAARATSRRWRTRRRYRCCLYSVPAFTGIPWPAGAGGRAGARIRASRGMKESSGDVGLLGPHRGVGAASLRRGLRLGARASIPRSAWAPSAGILAVACCAPGLVTWRSTARSRPATTRARAGCRRRSPRWPSPSPATYGVAGLKAAMDLAGFRGGPVRAPLLPLPPAAREELRALLAAARQAATA